MDSNQIPDFYSSFKPIRNRLKNYWSEEIVIKALESLKASWNKSVSEYNDQKIIPPWTSLLVMKWGLIYGTDRANARKQLNDHEWRRLAYSIFDLPAQLGHLDDPNPVAVWRFMRAYTVHQFYFQRNPHFHGLALFETIQPYIARHYPLEEKFLEFTGIHLETFIELQLLILGFIIAGSYSKPFKSILFEKFSYRFQISVIEQFLNFSSMDLKETESFLRKDHQWVNNPEFEMGLLSPLHKKPFLRIDDKYIAYHPTLLGEYIEHGIYDILREKDPSGFPQSFGYAFEEYVNLCLSISHTGCFRESTLKKILQTTSSPDFGITSGTDILLIEAKSAEMHPHTRQNPKESHLKRTLENSVIKGYQQIISAANAIRDRRPKEFPAEGKIFGLIISLKPLYLGSPTSIWQEFMENSMNERFDKTVIERSAIPPEHIFCLSAYEFDVLCAYCRETSMDLLSAIKTIVQKNSVSGAYNFFLESHLKDVPITMNSFPHIREKLNQIMDRMEQKPKNPSTL